MSEKASPSAVDAVTQLMSGPSLREIASKTLRPALKTLYPDLDIDPQLAMVVSPTWIMQDDQVIAGIPQIESLTDALVRLGLSGTTLTYFEGEHFLTTQPDLPSPIQLPVKIDAISLLLNELAPLLFIAFKEQHVEYWDEFTYPGQPRWQQLSDALRNLWNVDASLDWDADQRAMAHIVFNHPDKQERLQADKYKTRACLIDLDRDDDKQQHLTLLDCAVLVGTVGKRTLIITHSVIHGFQRFDSLNELSEALPSRYWQNSPNDALKWRLVEPHGNFFDRQACTLIAMEAEALGRINFFQGSTADNLFPHPGGASNSRHPLPRLKTHIDRLSSLLPPWLGDATAADQTRYSRHLLDLTMVQHSNSGKTFQSEVVSLQAFAREALRQQILKEQPTAGAVNVDDLEITITSLVVWGTFVLPGTTQSQTFSLLELALQNLAGLPPGNKTLRYKDDRELPAWMTVAYLEKLVSTVDVGKSYLQHLQKLLIDDTEQAAALQALYTSQLSIELPLLALQHKIQGKAGINELGYRYVVAALARSGDERYVDDEEIVIRRLSFIAHRSSARADIVNNMFVIGPREAQKGPCVLYRPLFELALIQYPSHANLLYAIQHSRPLRESVLAWLPDDVRFNYSQFVFTARLPSVWTIPQLLVNPTTSLDMSGPVTLGSAVIAGDVLGTLHDSNVQAVITQADRQSVSDAEARWATLKHGGWMVFNAALPFLGRSAGTAAWIWQIMDDLQEVSDVANEQSGKTAWTAITDILLALGMVLAHRAAVGDKPPLESITAEQEEIASVTPESTIIRPLRLPDITSAELPVAHELPVNMFTALKRSPVALAALLDSFKIDKPEGLGDAVNEGTHQHLHAKNRQWYAAVGTRWFEVLINANDEVQIIDSRQQPPRPGPLLVHTAGGQWIIDLRLRLHGGGLRSGRKQARINNKKQVETLLDDIEAFDKTMAAKSSQLDLAHTSFHAALPQVDAEARTHYVGIIDSMSKEYGEVIKKIKAVNLKETIPNYRTVMAERLEMQLFLGQEWIAVTTIEFQKNLDAKIAMGSDPHVDRQTLCETLNDDSQSIIGKIESAHSDCRELELLGNEAVKTLSLYRQALSHFDVNDYKLLQIYLGKDICVKPGETEAHTQAQETLDAALNDATLSIQSALNLTVDETLTNLRERIAALSNVSEQFAAIDQRLGDLASEHPDEVNTERLEHVRSRLIEIKVRTDQRLADLLRNKHLLEPQPGPSRPSLAWRRKIIKTKSRGTLVGERKKNSEGQDTDLVEVRSSLTGVIATFHEETPGVWVEQGEPKASPPARPAPNLNKSIRDGQALIDGLAAFHRRIESRIKRGKLPIEVEEDYHQQATLLRNANKDIDEALTASNLTADLKHPTEALGHALDKAAATLEEKGTSTRIRMVKQWPPTAAGVLWLKGKGEVEISQTVTRRKLKRHANDFLDEYQISDAHTHKVLCYAHFHYSSVSAPVTPFPVGHMKTVAQQRMGGAYETRGLENNQRLIEIHRSLISSQSAEALFLTPATPVADATAPL